MRTWADEARSPKYSHVERERRFLVDLAMPAQVGAHILIEDRDIIGTRFRLRRMTDSASGAVALKLAKKYEATVSTARPMVNAYLTDAEFATFFALPAKMIVKRRYPVVARAVEFGVDVFEGPLLGLRLAEIEINDPVALAAIGVPDWASTEVTEDLSFQGGALAELDADALAALLIAHS